MKISRLLPLASSDRPLVAGLALLWFSLAVSPYYPLSLSPLMGGGPAAIVTAGHSLYALCLIACYGALAAFGHLLSGPRAALSRRIAGIGGTIGCALLFFVPVTGWPGAVLGALAVLLVACATAFFFVAWLSLAAECEPSRAASAVGLSFVVFSVLWLLFILAGERALDVASACAPALSLACLERIARTEPRPSDGPRHPAAEASPAPALSSLRPLPWGVIVLLATFIYFGAIAVRLFTTMGAGVGNVGALLPQAQALTALGGLVLVGVFTVILARKGATTFNIVSVAAAIALVYMATLLVLTLANPASAWVLFAKRILVAAEHSAVVLLLACLAANTAEKHLPPTLLFGLAGIVACAVPPLLSQDILLASGALPLLSNSPFIAPVASMGAFFIAAAAIALLVNYSRGTVAQAQRQPDQWQEELCRRATASYPITDRELDVVVLTYRGHSAKKIAETLYVSESTVKTHLTHVYRKLAVRNKQELIALIDSYRPQ